MKTRILFLSALAAVLAPGFGGAVAGPSAPTTYPGRLALVQHQDGPLYANANPSFHDIWVWDFSGAAVNASHDRNVASADPAWFPDGRTLAWSGGGNLFVGGADGTGATNLTLLFFSANFVSPAPSPDGKTLAFTDTNGETLYRAPLGSSGYLTNFDLTSLGVGRFPAWTPDGKAIVATRWANRTVGEIDRVDPTTAGRTTLRATVGFADRTGDVSPDGSRLVFVSDQAGSDDVWVVGIDASGAFLPATAKNLTATTGASEADPCWSPDGRYIAFVDTTASQLRIMNADGTNVVSFPQLGSVYGVAWGGSAPAPAPAPDTTAPKIGLTLGTDSLWPPNHQLVSVGIGVAVSDDTDADPTVSVTVASDEPDDAKGGGDGRTTGDAAIVLSTGVFATSPGHESVTAVMNASDLDGVLKGLLLRAERSGKGAGRTYTITVAAADAAGNESTATATVSVAHDRKKK